MIDGCRSVADANADGDFNRGMDPDVDSYGA
jgi:hypothetical protein